MNSIIIPINPTPFPELFMGSLSPLDSLVLDFDTPVGDVVDGQQVEQEKSYTELFGSGNYVANNSPINNVSGIFRNS